MSIFQPDSRRRRDPQTLVEEAVLDFTLGENNHALAKLLEALTADPEYFPGYHALSEVYFSMRNLPMALAAATKAHALRPDDVHVNTSLSRIYMELGDKPQAEHFGAQARMLSWKDELKEPPPPAS
jgi:tetratricopeptide (TPR) repeat protein